MQPIPRQVQDWLNDIQRGLVRLPRFQRDEVWTSEKVENFLWALLRERPIGVFLVLEANPAELLFETRPLPGTPENGETCRQYLLDGQQRLTALWRSFSDNYPDRVYYVSFEEKNDRYVETGIKAVKRTTRESGIIGDPVNEFGQKLLPINILGPENVRVNSPTGWRKKVEQATECNDEYLDNLIMRLRDSFSGTQLSYFSLPQHTPIDEAIDIFIETNRSSVPLSSFDLAVAQMELKASESLKDRVEELIQDVPAIADLETNVGDLVLKIQCLFEGKKPTNNYRNLDFEALSENWVEIVKGIHWTAKTLGELHIFDGRRLPTGIPLRVLPALHRYIPQQGAKHANAMRLIKRYLWWAFLTDRYDRQANDRLKEDFDRLVDVLQRGKPDTVVPVFKSERPDEEDIKEAGWPKGRGRLSRAMLVACSLDGAMDIASNRSVLQKEKVDHHHIFPKAPLKATEREPDRALNCMLLEPLTNKEWSKKWPGDYLIEMVGATKYPYPEKEIEKRLNTHLLPAQKLISIKDDPESDLGSLYDEFLHERVKLVVKRINKLLARGNKE